MTAYQRNWSRSLTLFIVSLLIAAFGSAGWFHARAQQRSAPAPKPKTPRQSAAGDQGPKQDSTQVSRLNNLGTAYMNQQQFAQALKLFEEAAALEPQNATLKLNEGIALLNMQQFPRAVTLLEQVTKSEPNNAHVWYVLGLAAKNTGDAKQASSAFQRATQLAPADPDAWYFLATSQAQEGRSEEALASYNKALALSPLHASAEFGIARTYQKLANEAEARKHMARFRQLVDTKVSKPMGVAYGDQGPLSIAEQLAGTTPVPPLTAGAFTDISASSGLHAPAAKSESAGKTGACFLDYDNDGLIDIFLARSATGQIALYRNFGGGKFQDVTARVGLAGKNAGMSCATADYDNDGFTDIAVSGASGFALFKNNGKGHFDDVAATTGIGAKHNAEGMLFVDYDHDGDLDVYFVGEHTGAGDSKNSANALFRNNGDGKFTDVSTELGLASGSDCTQAIVTDFNNDRAVDLAVACAQNALYLNPREGPWKPSSVKLDDSAVAFALADFDKDGWPDIVLTRSSSPALMVLRNKVGGSYEQLPLTLPDWSRAFGVVTLDYDNDGWPDVAALGETKDGKRELRLFRNVGPKGFQDVTHDAALDRVALGKALGLYTADVDNDGATDLLLTQEDRGPVLLHNGIGYHNNFVRLSLKGLADSKTAIGTKVEVFAGALYQRWELSPSAYLGQNSAEIIAGLGNEKAPDVVRFLWPTGVIQDEIQIAARKRTVVTEIDRRGSSCPVLFAWNGHHYEFVTDMLGAGVLGHWISPTEKNIPDPKEYVKLENVSPVLKNGRLSFRLMEPLEEAVFVDSVKLIAVDHPAGTDVYPNDYFASQPPYAEFKVIRSRNAVPPTGAWDDSGHDVLPALMNRDKHYVTGFKVLQWAGFTKPHRLELQLPRAYEGGPLRMLMNGYIEYFTATSMYAAHQAGLDPFAPYVEALTPEGKWVRVVDDMGFPAGLPRTMVADLTGKLPRGTTRIRLTTNLQIYWDQVLFDTTDDNAVPVVTTEAKLSTARLAFHGYPLMIERGLPGDVRFVYDEVSATGPFARQPGAYTRTGDVLPLLTATDDKFAVFGSGDELQLDFDPGSLPPLRAGWKRDYFFFADGYEKDMDFYAADGLTVGPMPFQKMTTYPYTSDEHYPDDADHLRYELDYNSRHFSGAEAPSYRFEYPHSRRSQSPPQAGTQTNSPR